MQNKFDRRALLVLPIGLVVLAIIAAGLMYVAAQDGSSPFQLWINLIFPGGALCVGLVAAVLRFFLCKLLKIDRVALWVVAALALCAAVMPILVYIPKYMHFLQQTHLVAADFSFIDFVRVMVGNTKFQPVHNSDLVTGLGWELLVGNMIGTAAPLFILKSALKGENSCPLCQTYLVKAKRVHTLYLSTPDEIAQLYKAILAVNPDIAAFAQALEQNSGRQNHILRTTFTYSECPSCHQGVMYCASFAFNGKIWVPLSKLTLRSKVVASPELRALFQ